MSTDISNIFADLTMSKGDFFRRISEARTSEGWGDDLIECDDGRHVTTGTYRKIMWGDGLILMRSELLVITNGIVCPLGRPRFQYAEHDTDTGAWSDEWWREHKATANGLEIKQPARCHWSTLFEWALKKIEPKFAAAAPQ